MRLFYAALALEAQHVSADPDLVPGLCREDLLPARQGNPEKSGHQTGVIAAAREAQADGFELIEGFLLRGAARRHGLARSYERMRDEILELKAAMPVDGACSTCMARWSPTATTTARATSARAPARSSDRKPSSASS